MKFVQIYQLSCVLKIDVVHRVEVHTDVTFMNLSILVKLVVARCIITAVLFYLATPFDETFDDQRIQQIQNILIAVSLCVCVCLSVHTLD